MTKSKSKNNLSTSEASQYSLLSTKLYIPQLRPNLVPRQRLIKRLNEETKVELTLISAPAGFGKTTLLSEWIHQNKKPVAWISLDKGDSDPVHFLNYLIAALQTIESSIGKAALTVLQSPQPPPVESVLTNLINEITAIPKDFILVLDDYHLIETKQIHNIIEFLLDHLPQQMQLVIASRADPPLPMARLRGRNQLSEFRASDLSFTTNETTEFFNRVMTLGLSMDDITMLESRTEGWIAGLQLAALSIQGRKDIPAFIKAFSGDDRHIVDYLAEEVFNRQPEHVRNFLLQTSVLNRLSGSLCDAVTGQKNSQQILSELDKDNLFIVPLDNKRHWYRYHQLFSDLLKLRLHGKQSDLELELHRRASEWYEHNGQGDDAIEHSLAAYDFKRAAHLIKDIAETVWQSGNHTKLMRWLEALPDEQMASIPDLCIFHAWDLLASGQHGAAELSLQAVEQALIPTTDRTSGTTQIEEDQLSAAGRMKLLGRVATIRSFLASHQGDVPGIIQYSRRALEYLHEHDLTWRSTAAIALGDARSINGEVVAAYGAYLEALEASKGAGNIYLILIASLKLTVTLRQQGRLKRVIEICQQQMQLANESGMSETAVGGCLLTIWGEVLAELNDLDGAMQQAKKGAELTGLGSDVVILGWSYLCLTRVLFVRRDMDGAEETIQKLEKIARESYVPPWITNLMAVWKARIWLMQGKVDATSQWVQERGLKIDDKLTFRRETEHVMLARILITQNRLDEASRLLDRLIKEAESGGRISRLIEMLLVHSLALQALGDTNKAMATLGKALSLAKPGSFIRIFVDEGSTMAELLEKILKAKADVPRTYVKKLLLAFKLSKLINTDDSLVEQPSDREMEVLGFIAAGLSNKKISEELFVSTSTIKTHIRNIYSKLNVHSRTEAVAKAKELGLL